MVTFITGGARSGKSRYAEKLAMAYDEVTYVATALAFDDEMKARIAEHRARRPAHWKTLEAYKGLGEAIASMTGAALLDCLTVMTTNLIMEAPVTREPAFDWDAITAEQAAMIEEHVMDEMLKLRGGLERTAAHVILVTNEVGMGIVPPNPLGRVFRDIAGRVSAMFAEMADEAILMVSGLPLRLK